MRVLSVDLEPRAELPELQLINSQPRLMIFTGGRNYSAI
jgi:hypothetical protein